jgi:HEAT repeat protein
MLPDAFNALKTYDWGTELAALAPIESAVTAAHGNAEARLDLEQRLLDALQSGISRDARDFVCRMLRIVGGAASVPILARLLADLDHSHMARYALERIPLPAAAKSLRDALPAVSGKLKIGVISSIGSRRDAAAVPALSALLNDQEALVARAAARALGVIGNVEAATALQQCQPSSAETNQAVIDARLACAESLLADNKTAAAVGIYKSLAGNKQPRLVRLAATRGLLACAARNG